MSRASSEAWVASGRADRPQSRHASAAGNSRGASREGEAHPAAHALIVRGRLKIMGRVSRGVRARLGRLGRTIGYASAPMDMARLLALQEIDTTIDRLSARKKVLESGGELATRAERGRRGRTRAGRAPAAARRRRSGSVQARARDRFALAEGRRRGQAALRRQHREREGARVDPARDREPQAPSLRSRGRDARAHGGPRGARTPGGGGAGDVGRAARTRGDGRRRGVRGAHGRSRRSSRRRSPSARRSSRRSSPDILELYEDLRKQKKGIGVAALVDGVCQGCHEQLSAMELDQIKRVEGVRRCEYCRRILVF